MPPRSRSDRPRASTPARTWLPALATALALALPATADSLLGYNSTLGGMIRIDPATGAVLQTVTGGSSAASYVTTGAANPATGEYTVVLNTGGKGAPPDRFTFASSGSQGLAAADDAAHLLYDDDGTLYGTWNDTGTNTSYFGAVSYDSGTSQYVFQQQTALPSPSLAAGTGAYAIDRPGNRYFVIGKNQSTGSYEVITVSFGGGSASASAAALSDQSLIPQSLGFWNGTLYVATDDGSGANWNVTTLDPNTGSYGATNLGTLGLSSALTGPSPVDQANGWWHFIAPGVNRGDPTRLVTFDFASGTVLHDVALSAADGVTELATTPEEFWSAPVSVPEPASAALLVAGALATLAVARRRHG